MNEEKELLNTMIRHSSGDVLSTEIYNEKGNWVERRQNKILIERTIKYY